ncbi:hypothetical protein ACFQ10_48350 [Streptomyces indonesiensis]
MISADGAPGTLPQRLGTLLVPGRRGGGVLDGRRAATHWELASQLAAAYPQVRVDGHPVFVRDGHGATSVGVSPSVYRARFRSTLGDRTR